MLLIKSLTKIHIDIFHLILLVSLWFTLIYNLAFFRNAAAIFATGDDGKLFIVSLALFLFSITVILLCFLCFRFFTKPVLALVFVGASISNYYMNNFNVVIDTTMITNIVMTDRREIRDLWNTALISQILLLGVLPAWLVSIITIERAGLGQQIFKRARLIGVAVVLMVVSIAPFSSHYTSFFREHKILRYYANPAAFTYSGFKYMSMAMADASNYIYETIGLDAHIPVDDLDRELIILVVGEAARADRFSLNGYVRETNPLLKKEDVISFTDVFSCGTATAYSLPCMFSHFDRSDFDVEEARNTDNLLDVLTHAGVHVLWRDNNSDSKGVADSDVFEDFRSPEVNPVCDPECRDVGMLAGLSSYIEGESDGDIVIVLHQMGNHGPAYYKRYPSSFEKFTPVCQTNQLENCTDIEIGNAYDNAILYTDYFLEEVITFLKTYDSHFQTAMYYMSDHGESLGENGLYLHGLPYMLAPETQKHVASIMWFGSSYKVDRQAMWAKENEKISHDNYFHTVLGLMEIGTEVRNPLQDIMVHAPAKN